MLSPVHGLQLVLGLGVWLAWFGLIYGLLTIGCMFAPPALEQGPVNWINGLLLVLTLFTAALLFYWALRSWRAAGATEQTQVDDPAVRRMIGYVAAGVHLTGAVATLAVGLPITYLPPCL